MKIYYAHCVTGALCHGFYSTLPLAQDAVATHRKRLGCTCNVDWVQDFPSQWSQKDCTCMAMENVWISKEAFDAPLPIV